MTDATAERLARADGLFRAALERHGYRPIEPAELESGLKAKTLAKALGFAAALLDALPRRKAGGPSQASAVELTIERRPPDLVRIGGLRYRQMAAGEDARFALLLARDEAVALRDLLADAYPPA